MAGKVYAVLASTVLVIVGILIMSNLCPTVLANVKNNPNAVNAITNVCSIFFQNAPHLVGTP